MSWLQTTKGPLVVGLGNPLMGDDGIGVTVARDLRFHRSIGAPVIEAGTPGFGLIELLTDERPVVFIDAVDAGRTPGSVFWVDPNEVAGETLRYSLHQVTLADVIDLLKVTGAQADIKIIGIQPEKIGAGFNLSDVLEDRLSEIIATTETMLRDSLRIGSGRDDDDG